MSFYGWKPYVPVAQRRARAKRQAESLAKKLGRQLCPVAIEGRKIATTFWGKAWCDNLESYSDYATRLPRGRTYVRNGSVVDLEISSGVVAAIVAGSEPYRVKVQIKPLSKATWKSIIGDCSQSIDSLIDLLQGQFSRGVMERLTRQEGGLFPKPREISMSCSCPDWATLCKHCAAVLYGVGSILDDDPELLFRLRNVDHLELVGAAVDGANLDAALSTDGDALAGEDLGDLFGIDLGTSTATTKKSTRRASTKKRATSKTKRPAVSKKKATAKKTNRSAKKAATKKKSPTKAKQQTAAKTKKKRK